MSGAHPNSPWTWPRPDPDDISCKGRAGCACTACATIICGGSRSSFSRCEVAITAPWSNRNQGVVGTVAHLVSCFTVSRECWHFLFFSPHCQLVTLLADICVTAIDVQATREGLIHNLSDQHIHKTVRTKFSPHCRHRITTDDNEPDSLDPYSPAGYSWQGPSYCANTGTYIRLSVLYTRIWGNMVGQCPPPRPDFQLIVNLR